MVERELRVGIVGMGIGKTNARGFAACPRTRVTALCDIDTERTAAFAAELGGDLARYEDYRELCREGPVDAVFVGTPNQLHAPIAVEALRRGKHVLVTKPLADSLVAARRVVRAAAASGAVAMMSLSTRFGPAVRYLGELARAGEFGEIYYGRARSIRRSGIPDWSRGFIEAGGGAFRDMGVHVLDAAWWLLGRPRPVAVSGVAGAKFGPRGLGYSRFRRPPRSHYRRYAADDYGGGLVRFADGQGLQVESFWASHQEPELNIEIFGTEAGARLRPLTVYRTDRDKPQDVAVEIPGKPEVWRDIAEHFAAAVLDGAPCDAPVADGLAVQEMMEALLKSARTGREVRIKEKRS